MKKKGLMIGGICLAVVAGILGYNHEAVRVVFHNVYSPSVKLDESTEWDGGILREIAVFRGIGKRLSGLICAGQ